MGKIFRDKDELPSDGSLNNQIEEAEKNSPIKDREPIDADVRPVTEKSAKEIRKDELLRIVAGIVGCAYDDLKQRDKQRESINRRNQSHIRVLIKLVPSLVLPK